MEIDSIITFKRVLRKQLISKEDKMLLSSAINNNNININLSINENIRIVNKDGISLDELLFYLEELLGSRENYLDVPIYELLLEKSDLRDLLLNAYKKNYLSEESALAIALLAFEYLEKNDSLELVNFLNHLFSIKGPSDYELFQQQLSVCPFVYGNLDDIYNGTNEANKSMLVSLISFGYINLDILSFTVDNSYTYIENFFRDLINNGLYGYVRVFVNNRTVSKELALIIQDVVNSYQDKASEDKRLDHFIKSMNEKISNIVDILGNNRH